MSLYFLSIPPKKLSQSITYSSSSFKLNNIKSWKRNALGVTINLASSDFGTTAYGCFRNDTGTKIEIFEFDPATIASSSITILKRGLDFNGDLTTQTTNYKLDWSANETTVQLGTDVPQLFQYLKEYIDGIAISGSPDASTTTKGIVEEATQAEVDAGTGTGGTGAKLFVTPVTLASNLASTLNDLITIETTTGVTHSLTTIAGEKVIVWAKGWDDRANTLGTINLKYNGVTKDTISAGGNGNSDTYVPFSLMYTETPGAATANITVTDGVSLQNVVIIVLKIKAALI